MSNLHTHRNEIGAFLRRSGAPDDLTDTALLAADQVFDAIDEGRYPLYNPDRCNPRVRQRFEGPFFSCLGNMVLSVTARPVDRIICVSAAKPIPPQPWMTTEAYEWHRDVRLNDAAQEILEDSADPTFEDVLENAQSERLERALTTVARDRKFDLVWGTIDVEREQAAGIAAHPSFSWRNICFEKLSRLLDPVHEKASDLVGCDAWRIHAALNHLFAFTIAGDRECVMALEGLVANMVTAIPIGWKKDKNGALLVRIA